MSWPATMVMVLPALTTWCAGVVLATPPGALTTRSGLPQAGTVPAPPEMGTLGNAGTVFGMGLPQGRFDVCSRRERGSTVRIRRVGGRPPSRCRQGFGRTHQGIVVPLGQNRLARRISP